MAITVLENDFALTVGCDLWIVADNESSRWSRRIDWLLNFQMRRAALHRTAQLSPELSKLIKDCEADPVPVPDLATHAPLMIASARLLPAQTTVMIPSGTGDDWAKACHRVWMSLERPLARIFLPEGVTAEHFTRHWPTDEKEPRGIEVVL